MIWSLPMKNIEYINKDLLNKHRIAIKKDEKELRAKIARRVGLEITPDYEDSKNN